MKMLSCRFCDITGPADSDLFQLDKHNRGFWCEDCDSFNYLQESSNKHRFTLILEDKRGKRELKQSPGRKFHKRLSPYRYPGGKSKVIHELYEHLQVQKSEKLISPFTGGGSFELAMLESGVVKKLHLNDLDTGVYALWSLMKENPTEILQRIKHIQPTHQDYFDAQTIIKSDYHGVDKLEAGWASLLVNRLAYSGVCKANPLGGRNGSQESLLSRWNPKDLCKRIEKIHSMGENIEVTKLNAFELIEESYWEEQATVFIDPPYVEKGKSLYHCYYGAKDHVQLSNLLDLLHSGFPGADILVTYDFNEWLTQLYEFPKIEILQRTYSV